MAEQTGSQQDKIIIDYSNIGKYLRDKHPYFFVDKAEVTPGFCAKGYKNVTLDEWYFEFHFPGDPVMPGVFQMEAIMQVASLCIFTLPGNQDLMLYMGELEKAKILRAVRPGDRLDIEVNITSFKRGIVKGYGVTMVDGAKASEAKFTLLAPEIIAQFRVKK